MASQTEVEFPHAVMAWVVNPHVCEDFTNGFPLSGQKSGMDRLGENMEENNLVFDAFKIRNDLQPAAEVPPLASGGGVFLEEFL